MHACALIRAQRGVHRIDGREQADDQQTETTVEAV